MPDLEAALTLRPVVQPPTEVDAALSLDDDIKTRRRIKHEKDMLKRARGRPAMAMMTPSSSTPSSASAAAMALQSLSIAPSTSFSTSAPPSPRWRDREPRNGYAIPRRRREKQALVELAASCPARSWPPDVGELMGKTAPSASEAELVSTLAVTSPLATSAPEKRSLLNRGGGTGGTGSGGSSSSSSRRSMTLLDCASLFDEAGHLLSPDEFLLGTLPNVNAASTSAPVAAASSWNGRKNKMPKRRVGRHRVDKRVGGNDASKPQLHSMTEDAVVIELMQVLVPELDVAEALNLHFLGSNAVRNARDVDVFDFEQELDEVKTTTSSSSSNGTPTVDLPKLQASLTHLLFGKTAKPVDLPPLGTTGETLVETLLTDRWVASALLQIVQLDVLAQYDAFAVLQAMFRTLPSRRLGMLTAMQATCLAVHEHQRLDTNPESSSRNPRFRSVSMKGCLAFLTDALRILECDVMDDPNVFGDSPEDIDHAIAQCCDRILTSLQLLARSSPGVSARGTDNGNQVEKFMDNSESVEATTYQALAETVNRFARFSPCHGQAFLQWMVRKWPQRNVQLEIFFLRFLEGILMQFCMLGIPCAYPLIQQAFARLGRCIESPHFLVAKEATSLCGNLPLMSLHLARNASLRAAIAAALHRNATTHWNARIRELSDERFDLLLDFA